ncbi:hypothetical protein Tco_1341415, partial [Tanacetum coccineum]
MLAKQEQFRASMFFKTTSPESESKDKSKEDLSDWKHAKVEVCTYVARKRRPGDVSRIGNVLETGNARKRLINVSEK